MAATTPASPPATPPSADLEQIVTDLTRVVARMVVQAAPGAGAATFAQLAVNGLKVATHEEAARIESWLTSHQ